MNNLVHEGMAFLKILKYGKLHPASKHLVVKGQAGLCNRLWYLLAAMSFANRWGLSLSIDWRDGLYAAPNENAFEQLFEHNRPLLDPDEAYQESVYPAYWSENPSISFDQLHGDLKKSLGRLIKQKDLMYPLWSLLIEKPAAATILCTGYRFSGRELSIARSVSDPRILGAGLSLSVRSREFVNTELPMLTECIGVHVRRTDSRRQVELEQYYRKIPNNERLIFLCTDSREVDSAFRSRYGDRMVLVDRIYPETGHRLHSASNDIGLRSRMALEAVRDLYGLSRCGTIVHGINSSFSRFAIQVLADPKCSVHVARPRGERWGRVTSRWKSE